MPGRQELADLVHLHPSDFQLPWFLSFVFGHPAPEDSLVVQAQKLTPENAEELVTQYKFPYSFLRKNLPDMSLKVKAQVALYEVLPRTPHSTQYTAHECAIVLSDVGWVG